MQRVTYARRFLPQARRYALAAMQRVTRAWQFLPQAGRYTLAAGITGPFFWVPYIILTELRVIRYWEALLICTILQRIFKFFFHKHLVFDFHELDGTLNQLILYFSVISASYFAGVGMTVALVEWYGAHYVVATVPPIFITGAFNYVMKSGFVFVSPEMRRVNCRQALDFACRTSAILV